MKKLLIQGAEKGRVVRDLGLSAILSSFQDKPTTCIDFVLVIVFVSKQFHHGNNTSMLQRNYILRPSNTFSGYLLTWFCDLCLAAP